MTKISIVGANSLIARNLIYVIDERVKNGEEFELSLYDCHHSQADGKKNYQQINVMDIASLKNINFDVDIIYFFTGKTGTMQGFDEYMTYIDINEVALLNFISAYREAGSKAKIVFPSSRLVYKGKSQPLKEDDEKEAKTLYAANKLSAEMYLKMYHDMFDLQYVIFRICVPYGSMINETSYGTIEFMLGRVNQGLDISLYGDGSLRRTITHMQDLCDVLIDGALSDKCCNDIFNVGGEDYSLLEMATLLSAKYGQKVVFTEWPENALKIESGDTVFDSGKLDNIIGNKYSHKFEEWIQ